MATAAPSTCPSVVFPDFGVRRKHAEHPVVWNQVFNEIPNAVASDLLTFGHDISGIGKSAGFKAGGRRRTARQMVLATLAATDRALRRISDLPRIGGCGHRKAPTGSVQHLARERPSRRPIRASSPVARRPIPSNNTASADDRSKPRTRRHAAVIIATSLPCPISGRGFAAKYRRARSTTSQLAQLLAARGIAGRAARSTHVGLKYGTSERGAFQSPASQ